MSALRFHGPVLPSGEVRDLFVVGDRVTYESQPGAELAASGWIVPGLVDAHCHIGLGPRGAVSREETEAQAIADRDGGALLIRDCGSASDTRWVQEREDLPRLVRAARHISRTKRYMPGYADEVEPESLVETVTRQARRGDGWVKLVGDWIDRAEGDLRPSFSAEEFRAAIDAAHAAGAKVTAHCFGTEVLPGLIDAGIDCIEHGSGLTPELAAAMGEKGIALVPTVAQLELFPQLSAAAEAKFPAYAGTMDDLYARRRETLMTAHEAGVTFYAGSDGAAIQQHGTLHKEIAALAGLGLPSDYVLGAASWRAREWLGFTPDLAEGSEADFVVYDRDPLADLSVTAERPAAIVLRGRVRH
ncbi:amidohydrolase family protein [Nocardioides sp. Kera G14]|uniref:amidohydrolase family protein n=1 Tax=Nocardioides sp. Kera G14 TaxID=2884264 RepID=UPI001D105D48|nr:amidohydrolase family protein [Nocardioides sp. Kera G14]UDY22651.1 amidohydrolase family protein [Nocardioides sp. Kera G14]